MVGRRPPIDDSVVMASSGYQNLDDDRDVNGIANASFVREGACEEVDHVGEDDTASANSDTEINSRSCPPRCRWRKEYATVAVLVAINLLNYMDRFTLPGVEEKVKNFYNISRSEFGLLQTCFICSYMVFSPLFGFLGDRFNRKILMACGIFLWIIIVFSSSFVPQDHFWLFLLTRALIGVGEASYSTVAPTIFADMFQRDERTKVLAVFYFAIPVGSGLGYIVGSEAAQLFGQWQWSLRVTPILGVILFILILLVVRDPPRGGAEGGERLHTTSYGADLRYLFRNKSYIFTTLGFTAVSYVTGALAWWAPAFFLEALKVRVNSADRMFSQTTISLAFGGVTMVAGVTGVVIGSETARRWRSRVPHVDALVCGAGLLASTPFVFFALILSQYNIYATFVLVLLGEVCICLNWSLVVDILLAVVIPTRQATASGILNLIAHAFGDAGSPFLVGEIADRIAAQHKEVSPVVHFFSLQYALYSTVFVTAVGGGFFLLVAIFYSRDRARYRRVIEGSMRARTEPETPSQQHFDYDHDQDSLSAEDGPETQLNVRNRIT